jgi:hypothetical protein
VENKFLKTFVDLEDNALKRIIQKRDFYQSDAVKAAEEILADRMLQKQALGYRAIEIPIDESKQIPNGFETKNKLSFTQGTLAQRLFEKKLCQQSILFFKKEDLSILPGDSENVVIYYFRDDDFQKAYEIYFSGAVNEDQKEELEKIEATTVKQSRFSGLQPEIDKKIKSQYIFGLLWIGGIGSFLAVINGYSAMEMIIRSKYELRGISKVIIGLIIAVLGIVATSFVIAYILRNMF